MPTDILATNWWGHRAGTWERMLPGVTNDMVWEDTYGIMYWRCFLTVAMTLVSIKLFRHMMDVYGTERKVLCVGILLIYVIAILISLRVIF